MIRRVLKPGSKFVFGSFPLRAYRLLKYWQTGHEFEELKPHRERKERLNRGISRRYKNSNTFRVWTKSVKEAPNAKPRTKKLTEDILINCVNA